MTRRREDMNLMEWQESVIYSRRSFGRFVHKLNRTRREMTSSVASSVGSRM